MAVSEASVVRDILERLRSEGHFAEKMHGSGSLRRGFPDIIACIYGQFVAIEAKRPGTKTTKAQDRVLLEIRAAGGLSYVVDDPDALGDIIWEASLHAAGRLPTRARS